MQTKRKKMIHVLNKIIGIMTVVAVSATITMPVFGEDSEQTEVVSEPAVVSEEISNEIEEIPPVVETQQSQTPRMIQEVPSTYTVSFVLDDSADGNYFLGTTEITVEAGKQIDLNLVPDFESSKERKQIGWMINDQMLTGYANPYMYFMFNRTINENKVIKPVFAGYTQYTIQLGVKELNTGWLTGATSFKYAKDIPFNTVFTEANFNQVDMHTNYYFKGWELNGVLYTTYESLNEAASIIQNTNINLLAVFAKQEFTVEFFIDESSKGWVSFADGSNYIKYISDKTHVNGYTVIGEVPSLILADGYELDTWVLGLKNPQNLTQVEIENYFNDDDFLCNQYITVKVKKSIIKDAMTSTSDKDITENNNGVENKEEKFLTTTIPTTITFLPFVTEFIEETNQTAVANTELPVDKNSGTIETVSINSNIEDTTITDEKTPLALGNQASWALINLISMIITVILGMVFMFKKNSGNKNYGEVIQYKNWVKMAASCIAVLSVFMFIVTETMTASMVMIDKYTGVMLVITLVQVFALIGGRKKRVIEKEVLQ